MGFEGTSSSWSPVHKDNVPNGRLDSCTANAVSFDSLDLEVQVKGGTSYQVVYQLTVCKDEMNTKFPLAAPDYVNCHIRRDLRRI